MDRPRVFIPQYPEWGNPRPEFWFKFVRSSFGDLLIFRGRERSQPSLFIQTGIVRGIRPGDILVDVDRHARAEQLYLVKEVKYLKFARPHQRCNFEALCRPIPCEMPSTTSPLETNPQIRHLKGEEQIDAAEKILQLFKEEN